MIEIAISPEAYKAVLTTLKGCSLVLPAKRTATGDYLIYQDEKMVDRLGAMRGPRESYSDVIIRLAANGKL
jgi:hypothetical protein